MIAYMDVFPELMHNSIQGWEQGRRSPHGAAVTLLRVAHEHPEILEEVSS